MRFGVKIIALLLLVLISAADGQQKEQKNYDKQILLNVSVYDENINFLKNLKSENFEIYEENKRQEITGFTQADEPASIGILFDSTASMINPNTSLSLLPMMAIGLNGFLERSNPKNEYFIIGFGQKPEIAIEMTENVENVKKTLRSLAEAKPDGKANVYEALNLGFDKISRAKHEKKILIIISNGWENIRKKIDFDDINKLTKRENVLIYTVFVPSYIPYWSGNENIQKLTEVSGGMLFHTDTTPNFLRACELLTDEIKSQYQIRFKPNTAAKIGDWREIKVKVSLSKEDQKKIGKVSVKFRKGYYF